MEAHPEIHQVSPLPESPSGVMSLGETPPVQILPQHQGPNIPSLPPHLPTSTLTSTGIAYKNSTEVSLFRIKCFNGSARAGVKSGFQMRQHKTQNMLNSLLL